MTEKKVVYFGFKRNVGGPEGQTLYEGFGTSTDREFTTLHKDASEKKSAPQSEALTLLSVQNAYFDQMVALLDLFPIGASILPSTTSIFIDEFRREHLEGKYIAEEHEEGFITYEVPVERTGIILRGHQQLKRRLESIAVFPKLFLMGLVSQYDAYFAQLVRCVAELKPHIILGSQKQFTASEIFSHPDVDAFREAVIEKEIETILRDSHEKQFDWIERQLELPLRKGLSIWPNFIEICERRNLFAHSNGMVSAQYLHKCAAAEFSPTCKKGDHLSANPKYLYLATSVLLEIGVKLSQVIGRKLAENDEQHDDLNRTLNEICYSLIFHEHYDVAVNLLEFAFGNAMKYPDKVMYFMMIINHANALKLGGRETDSLAVLDKIDWKPMSVKFQLAVAAIKDDLEEVLKLMGRVDSDEVSVNSYLEWPIFMNVRKQGAFQRKLVDMFGDLAAKSFVSDSTQLTEDYSVTSMPDLDRPTGDEPT